jgi:hypothetical protein
MKQLRILLIPILLTAFPLTASADNDHGRGHKHGKHESKEVYWDGNCKVERKHKKNGDYKEKRKCKGPQHGYYAPEPRHFHRAPAVVHVPAPPAVILEPGITVHGTVRIPD